MIKACLYIVSAKNLIRNLVLKFGSLDFCVRLLFPNGLFWYKVEQILIASEHIVWLLCLSEHFNIHSDLLVERCCFWCAVTIVEVLLVFHVSLDQLLTIVDADLKWLWTSHSLGGALVGTVAFDLLEGFLYFYRLV